MRDRAKKALASFGSPDAGNFARKGAAVLFVLAAFSVPATLAVKAAETNTDAAISQAERQAIQEQSQLVATAAVRRAYRDYRQAKRDRHTFILGCRRQNERTDVLYDFLGNAADRNRASIADQSGGERDASIQAVIDYENGRARLRRAAGSNVKRRGSVKVACLKQYPPPPRPTDPEPTDLAKP